MILNSFISGLAIGLSLIMAIGAQNTFVFRQGLLGEYVWISILFCTFSDGLLIFAGTYGIGALITPYFEKIDSIIFLLTALWVGSYGGEAFTLGCLGCSGGLELASVVGLMIFKDFKFFLCNLENYLISLWIVILLS